MTSISRAAHEELSLSTTYFGTFHHHVCTRTFYAPDSTFQPKSSLQKRGDIFQIQTSKSHEIYDTAFSSTILILPMKKKIKVETECTASAPTTSLPTKDSSEMD